MFGLGLLTAAAYWPGVFSPAVTPRWAILWLAVPILLLWRPVPQRIALAHVLGALFIGWAAVSVAWSASAFDSVGATFILILLAACFCLGQNANLRPLYIGAALGLAISSGVAIVQAIGWHDARPPGLFVNPNLMGLGAALVVVALVSERIWWALPLVAPALILSGSRTAIVAAAVPLAVKWARGPSLLILAAVAVFCLIGRHGSIQERLDIWSGSLAGFSWLGHGAGSFWVAYRDFDPRIAPTGFPEHAHNEFLTTLFELGPIGLALLVAFIASLWGQITTARLVLIAFVLEMMADAPLHYPLTAMLGAVAAGGAARNWGFSRLRYVRRRGTFQASVV